MRQVLLFSLAGLAAAGLETSASAQYESTLIQPSVPIDYSRGRNVSVLETPRPDYDPLGIRSGGMLFFPRIEVGVGASDNVFLTDQNKKSDFYGVLAPGLRANSDWSRHQLQLDTSARLRRYADQSDRNQDEWNARLLGRLDIGDSVIVTADGAMTRAQEDPFGTSAVSAVAALSRYTRTAASLRGEYRGGHVRAMIDYDFQGFEFGSIEVTDGSKFSQENRDRDIHRITGQFEYALTPSTAIYGQITYSDTSYGVPLGVGVPNRDSQGTRAIAGLSLDLSGFFRGIVGVGYTWRNYDASIYPDVDGFSIEGKIEYFASPRTNYTLALRRVIEDSNLGNTSAFFDNRVSLRVDHEMLQNVLLNASLEYAKQDYIDSSDRQSTWRARGGGKWLLSRSLGLQLDLSYGSRNLEGQAFDTSIKEFQGLLALVVQR